MADWLSHLDLVDAGKEAEEPSPDSSAEEQMRHGYPAALEEAEGLAHAVTSNTWQLGSFLSYSPLRQHAISALLLCQTDIWLINVLSCTQPTSNLGFYRGARTQQRPLRVQLRRDGRLRAQR